MHLLGDSIFPAMLSFKQFSRYILNKSWREQYLTLASLRYLLMNAITENLF